VVSTAGMAADENRGGRRVGGQKRFQAQLRYGDIQRRGERRDRRHQAHVTIGGSQVQRARPTTSPLGWRASSRPARGIWSAGSASSALTGSSSSYTNFGRLKRRCDDHNRAGCAAPRRRDRGGTCSGPTVAAIQRACYYSTSSTQALNAATPVRCTQSRGRRRQVRRAYSSSV
jgi:hypothetical protein